MLQSLANSLSSPLVHGPLFYAILQLFSRLPIQGSRVFKWLSYIPLLWLGFCSLIYPSVMLIKPLEDQYPTKPLPIYLAAGIINHLDAKSQAQYNKEFLITLGVKAKDIHIFPQGHDTESEVDALAPHLLNKYIALVSSASHLPRAVEYFRLHKISVLPIPVEHLSRKNVSFVLGLPNGLSLYRSERAIHEYLGLIYQRYLK